MSNGSSHGAFNLFLLIFNKFGVWSVNAESYSLFHMTLHFLVDSVV